MSIERNPFATKNLTLRRAYLSSKHNYRRVIKQISGKRQNSSAPQGRGQIVPSTSNQHSLPAIMNGNSNPNGWTTAAVARNL